MKSNRFADLRQRSVAPTSHQGRVSQVGVNPSDDLTRGSLGPAQPLRGARRGSERTSDLSRRGSVFLGVLICLSASSPAIGQAILAPWGNLLGVRVHGHLVEFEGSTRALLPDESGFHTTVKYLQRPQFTRTNQHATVDTKLAGLEVRHILEDVAPGRFTLRIRTKALQPDPMSGAYFCLELPMPIAAGAGLEWIGSAATRGITSLPNGPFDHEIRESAAHGLRLQGHGLTLEIQCSPATEVRLRQDASERPTRLNNPQALQKFLPTGTARPPDGLQVYFRLLPGNAVPGQETETELRFTVDPKRDDSPATIAVDLHRPGARFDGIGGNFRLQFPETDPAVIEYNLDHLRVAWGRVAMPWAEWDPNEDVDPLESARHRTVDRRVADAMSMARTLARRGMPVIVSAWSPPSWGRALHQPQGLRGTALNPAKLQRLCRGIGAYLAWLKTSHGVEADFFSLNEPEIGVEVRQTPDEHCAYLKAMGAELADRGLATRLLLGDTAHAIPSALAFLKPSMDDPATHRHIGAIAFHTWRGCTDTDLHQWSDAARSLRVPLLATEAGPDAHLHEYPSIMLEPWFALQEIDLYLRVCSVAQPATVMHWQLTADYSVLWGAGVYGSDGPIRPTQRFWNLCQLGRTPPGAFALPISKNRADLTCAAFGQLVLGQFAIHVVNRGADRDVTITGLPDALASLQPLVTDATRGMLELPQVPVEKGVAHCRLPTASYLTFLGTTR
ncbi:MAG: hypothetical protein JNK85_05725 [Verrucomicrobiales bacterium]|nr:hypothetical protein [Verrucomicrobiales bacterium]